MTLTTPLEQRSAGEGASTSSNLRMLRLSPDGNTNTSSDAGFLKTLNDLAQAIRDKNVDRLMTFYASDVVVFDLRPPLDMRGAAAYRVNLERWFATFEGSIGFELTDVRIAPFQGAAFCHYLRHITGTRLGGRTVDYRVRGTTCFELRDGQWLVTHEHVSMPTLM